MARCCRARPTRTASSYSRSKRRVDPRKPRADLRCRGSRSLALDEKGFINTVPDLTREELQAFQWPLPRPPYLLETSRLRVFDVGEVRCGNLKRLASAAAGRPMAVARGSGPARPAP